MIRRIETEREYKTLKDDVITRLIVDYLELLTNILHDKITSYDRKTLIKVAVALNNILYKIDE